MAEKYSTFGTLLRQVPIPATRGFVDHTGIHFTRWTVLYFAGYGISGKRQWVCQCDCGIVRAVNTSSFVRGLSKSCGCLERELLISRNEKHRHSKLAEYRIWAWMKHRCNCPKSTGYKEYGGRGIQVCQRWLDSFENFLADMGPRPSKHHQIDRYPDNNGNYEPTNCRWATRIQNARNKRNNRLLTLHGITRCQSEWAEYVGLTSRQIDKRLRSGWSIERALAEPLRKQRNTTPLFDPKPQVQTDLLAEGENP